ncbi:hypothetical protein CAY60_005285 [Shouchella clausii]|jgi:hypothetical protein|uniref:Uncharacterized protein n=2 Tax=Shouchella TaxID=2893057 RepID=Q5WJW6_SHOC1|nr:MULTISPECIES: hypothetical protein [Shouchella]MCM3314179.1 hypothetical protein [Psychrobacillus sp. MER TA 17]ALA52031.1 hypothetical protein DB29_01203 [Shouchella clausii]KKI84796.1 hypothetical protein WZ76_19010 [Shouchella clausii]MBU3230519.1 hypothetical protein [Shouchella clausii]MBU3262282.1 hypothetical protein [Shouchella clausii]
MGRKRYFVTIDMAMMRLSTTKTPDNSIQYEIYATDEEADKIKALLEQIRSEDFREEQVFQHPFQEKKADQEKEATQNELQELYQIIYDLGTIETKEVVKDLK